MIQPPLIVLSLFYYASIYLVSIEDTYVCLYVCLRVGVGLVFRLHIHVNRALVDEIVLELNQCVFMYLT